MNDQPVTGTPVPPVPEHLSREGPVHRPVSICTGVPPTLDKLVETLSDPLRAGTDVFVSEQVGRVVDALWGVFRTPNEMDSNGEPANVVDGLFAIARSIFELGRVIEERGEAEPLGTGPARVRLKIPDELAAPRRRRA